jgi:hypothetical protein
MFKTRTAFVLRASRPDPTTSRDHKVVGSWVWGTSTAGSNPRKNGSTTKTMGGPTRCRAAHYATNSRKPISESG